MSRNFLGVAAIVAGLAFGVPIASKAQGITDRAMQDQISNVPRDDRAMKAAFSKARATLPGFLKIFDNPPAGIEHIGVKVGIRENGKTEYFWVSPFERKGRQFAGRLNNRPRVVSNVVFGQEIQFSQNEIVDWTYSESQTGRMKGNFTACAVLVRETPAEQKRFKETFGLRC